MRLEDQVALFHDIEVVPTTRHGAFKTMANGGPIWPDFDRQTTVRHYRQGKMIDVLPIPHVGPHERIERPCVWVGYAMDHFGHLIAEHLQRVLTSLTVRPDDLYLFVLGPGKTEAQLPAYFWQLLEWYGLPVEQVHFVTKPTIVAELRCMPQAEPLGMDAPSPEYLALLDANAGRHAIAPVVCDVAYVGRLGLLGMGLGAHAGESYLAGVLERSGVHVMDPLKVGLRGQLAVYAGAKTLVFVEGSAIHGRQLLGRIDQKIVILCRRRRSRIAKAAIEVRCRSLDYAEVLRRFVTFTNHKGVEVFASGLSFYNVKALVGTFRAVGVDLAPLWDADAFAVAEQADALLWLKQHERSAWLPASALTKARADLLAEGVDLPDDAAKPGEVGS